VTVPWITSDEVTDVYPNAELTEEQIAHIQSLAEGCIGQHDEVPPAVKAIMVDWAYRFWQALNTNPDGITQEQTGPFMRSFATQPALGITDRDCQLLRKAIGMTGLGVISTTRGPVEMADPCGGLYDCEDS